MGIFFKHKLKIFKILFFLLFPSLMFADDNDINLIFHVSNNLMVDVYYNIFNGIVMLLQDSTYLSILKVVFLLGGFFVFIMGIAKVFSGGDAKAPIFDFFKYMLIGVIMLSVLFNGKTKTILVQSDEIPTYCHVDSPNSALDTVNNVNYADSSGQVLVSNVPEVLAFSYILMNRVGTDMTKLASNYFSLPGGFKPPMDGFASFLAPIGETISLTFDKIVAHDSNGSMDSAQVPFLVNKIVQSCILTPSAEDSKYGAQVISTLENTGYPMLTIHNLIQNGDLIYYKNPDDTEGTTIASDVTANGTKYKDIITTFFGKSYNCGDLETKLNDIYNDTSALQVSCLPGSISKSMTPKSLAVLTGPNSDGSLPGANRFREVALNAAMMNTIANSANKLGLGSLYFTQGKTIAEFVQSSLGSGYYMAQLLPFMQMALRAILYAFFPFVFIVALFPGGLKVLLSYAQTILWIELWAPTAAILNFFLSYVSASDFQSMYHTGFNAVNATQVFSDSAILASVAGYLYASVPALTWLILKGSGYMLGNITGAIASKFSANLSNVDAYNKDIAEMKGVAAYNRKASLEGKKLVSLAEAEQMQVQKQTMMEFGGLSTLADYSNQELMNIGAGNMRAKMISGLSNNVTKREGDIIATAKKEENQVIGDQTKAEAKKMGYGNALKRIRASKDTLNELHAYEKSHNKAVKALAKAKGISEDMAALELMSVEYTTTGTMDHFKHDQALADILDPSGKYKKKDGTYDWGEMMKDGKVREKINKLGHADATKINEMFASIPANINKTKTELETMIKGGQGGDIIKVNGKEMTVKEAYERVKDIKPHNSLVNEKDAKFLAGVNSYLSGTNSGVSSSKNQSIVQNNLLTSVVNQNNASIVEKGIAVRSIASGILENFGGMGSKAEKQLAELYNNTVAHSDKEKLTTDANGNLTEDSREKLKSYLTSLTKKDHQLSSDDYAFAGSALTKISAESKVYETVSKASEINYISEKLGISAVEAGKYRGALVGAGLLGKGNVNKLINDLAGFAANKMGIDKKEALRWMWGSVAGIEKLAKAKRIFDAFKGNSKAVKRLDEMQNILKDIRDGNLGKAGEEIKNLK